MSKKTNTNKITKEDNDNILRLISINDCLERRGFAGAIENLDDLIKIIPIGNFDDIPGLNPIKVPPRDKLTTSTYYKLKDFMDEQRFDLEAFIHDQKCNLEAFMDEQIFDLESIN